MIQVANPGLVWRYRQHDIEPAIRRVLESGRYLKGNQVATFEKAYAQYIGVAQAVGVANGTDASHIILRALGIGPGDEVITVSHTAVATVAAIELAGATPVLVDIEQNYFTIDPDKVEAAISKRTKAIIAVHLYGQAADLDRLLEISKRYGLQLIEDCCQAHGAEYRGRKVGSFGKASYFSFYPTKNLGCFGDGGVIATNDEALAEKCRMQAEYGWKDRYISNTSGMNSRLDEIQAAVLNVRLKYVDEDNAHRKAVAKKYIAAFRSLTLNVPKTRKGATHVFHLFVICSRNRDSLADHLAKRSIQTAIHYPMPIHLQPAYRGRIKTLDQAVTERVADRILSLPIYPFLSDDNVRTVIEAVQTWRPRTRNRAVFSRTESFGNLEGAPRQP